MTRKVRESELEAMRARAERAEAHCERLRSALQRMVDEAAHLAGFSESTERAVLEVLNETPDHAQSIASIKAEAGREGFRKGWLESREVNAPHHIIDRWGIVEEKADEYAERIRSNTND